MESHAASGASPMANKEQVTQGSETFGVGIKEKDRQRRE
jgi:hypothetical protein